jgi:antitoxin CptB
MSKLRWRCRRGLLENDIVIDRFFKKHAAALTLRQAQGLSDLMALSDGDLLDLHLGRQDIAQINAALAQDDVVVEVLKMLKEKPERLP